MVGYPPLLVSGERTRTMPAGIPLVARLEVALTIGPDGKLRQHRVTGADERARRCIEQVFAWLDFAARRGNALVVGNRRMPTFEGSSRWGRRRPGIRKIRAQDLTVRLLTDDETTRTLSEPVALLASALSR